MPPGPSGHDTFTQSPTSRVTSSTMPCGAWPTTGLTMVGDIRTSARAAVTVSTVDCCAAAEAPTHTAIAKANTKRIIDDLLQLSNRGVHGRGQDACQQTDENWPDLSPPRRRRRRALQGWEVEDEECNRPSTALSGLS